MNILLSTYNFFPYNWGGSEVYVSGLVKHLQAEGHSVKLIAAVPDLAFEQYGLRWTGEQLKVCHYQYEGIEVYGVQHDLSTTDIYAKYRLEWEKDWIAFFDFLQHEIEWTPVLMHLHGFTAVIGLSLIRAFRHSFPYAPIHASYHTPISCPKGTLLRWEKEECSIRANSHDCSACTLQAKTKWPKPLVQCGMRFLPAQDWSALPTVLRWKALNRVALASFQALNEMVDYWWVFSDQIQKLLIQQGVEPGRINMGRHGIDPGYVQKDNSNRTEPSLIFAFVGRFKHIKGFHTLLQAWEQLPSRPDRQLWLIGDNQEADAEIQGLLTKIQQRNDVFYLGKQEPNALARIYTQVHALIIPSEWVEIGPLVFHEAVASGANVIASSIGGTGELAQYYSGVSQLFPMGDTRALSQAIGNYTYRAVETQVETAATHYTKVAAWYTAKQA